eukprot:7699467-Alexandrium_andersonii.AAC.1
MLSRSKRPEGFWPLSFVPVGPSEKWRVRSRMRAAPSARRLSSGGSLDPPTKAHQKLCLGLCFQGL